MAGADTLALSGPVLTMRVAGNGSAVRDRATLVLATRIIAGAYPPETLLPTESRLVAELGVSRTALREAVRTLAAKGFLEAKQRVGTRVRPTHEWHRLDPDVLGWMSEVGLDLDFVTGLIEFRLVVEPAAAALAAERASANELALIETAYLGMVRHLPNDIEACVQADVAFHTAILKASRNPVFANLGNIISAALHSAFRLTTSASRSYARTLDAHGEVLEAIRMRDPETARSQMQFLIGIAAEDVRSAPVLSA
ncbi:MAG: FadR family transcriptional regulator [Rhizobiales bacterium]|nr:FadR family transcriptional regulator [Hyphomicrobiales bacterium]